jgi:hypothetical protein
VLTWMATWRHLKTIFFWRKEIFSRWRMDNILSLQNWHLSCLKFLSGALPFLESLIYLACITLWIYTNFGMDYSAIWMNV